jgi:glycerophosphoryl diester phosphodiesterase
MGAQRWTFLDHPAPIAFAHRGDKRLPENTMAAFESAVRLGYRYVETDVQVTSDGVAVAFHDDTLDRLAGRCGRVAELAWSEARRIRIDGREPIARLDGLLGTWPNIRVNLDPKCDAAVAALVDALRRTNAADRVCIASFSGRRIDRVRKQFGPTLCWSPGPLAIARLRAASLGLPLGAPRAPCVQVPLRYRGLPIVDRAFVDAAHRRGAAVHVWTVNEADAMNRLLDLGVDGIMSARIEVLKSVFEARGAWVAADG